VNARTNKGVYIKLAQHLAQLDYLLPGFVFRVQGFRVGSEVRVETQPGSLLRGPRALPRFVALPLLRTRALFLVRAHARAPGVVRAAGRPCHAPCVHRCAPGQPFRTAGRRQGVRDTGRRGAGGPSRGGAADRRTAWPWPRADAWRTAAPRRSEAAAAPPPRTHHR